MWQLACRTDVRQENPTRLPQVSADGPRGYGRHGQIRNAIYFSLFASGFATSRACSMNSRATGESERFFRVTMLIGTCVPCSSTGRTLISRCLVGNLNREFGKIETKRPLATRFIRTAASPTAAAQG